MKTFVRSMLDVLGGCALALVIILVAPPTFVLFCTVLCGAWVLFLLFLFLRHVYRTCRARFARQITRPPRRAFRSLELP